MNRFRTTIRLVGVAALVGIGALAVSTSTATVEAATTAPTFSAKIVSFRANDE